MKVLKFRKFKKNSLRGFFELQLPSGMAMRDLTYHSKDNRRWVGYPSKPYTDESGNQKYQNQIYFPDKQVHEKFQQMALTALDSYFATHQGDHPADIPF